MIEVHEETELAAGADEVWRVVGDFVGFVEAMGVPVEGEGEPGPGQLRKMSVGDDSVVERVEERDERARRLVYSIVSGPIPVVNYRSTMQVTDIGGGRSQLSWVGTFEAAPGTADEAAEGAIRPMYQGGLAGLRARFGA